METRLVSITKPEIEGIHNAENLIVYCARVSNPENQINIETAPKLIRFLIDHKHWSPFEMVNVCFEIKTSRAIAAQILRHRSFSFQEFSQRYSEVTELEPVELRYKANKNRQSSSNIVENKHLNREVEKHLKRSLELYDTLIDRGVAKETARMILPLTTETTLYMSGTLRSWIHWTEIRCKENTQKEHREIAESIKKRLKVEFPNVFEALSIPEMGV